MAHRMRLSLALFLLLICQIQAFIPGTDGPVTNQEGLEGGNATLFCNSATDAPGDELMLLVWYRDNVPVYSYDARNSLSWSSEVFNTSSRVSITLHPQPTALLITRLRDDDEALYHCRVDFLVSPTRNIGVNLSVTVLPSTPFFMDELGNKVESKVGPYHEGDTLVLSCLVVGGRPPPRITWYSGDMLVDASDGASEVPGVRENELYLPLTRDSVGPLSCRAVNTKLTDPVVASVQIELYLAALNVSIEWMWGVDGREALAAGRGARARCAARGGRPVQAVALTWWLGGVHVTGNSTQSWSGSGGVVESYLQLTPSPEHHGATLSCIATNDLLAPERASRADVITLNVTYSPIVEVTKIGTGKMDEVIELDPLLLECEVRANPPADQIEWYFNDMQLQPGAWTGTNTTHLSSSAPASRALAGTYSCSARNSLGKARAALNVTVLYKPECIHSGITLIQESLHCDINSLPDPDVYFWHITPSELESQHLTTGSSTLPLSQITGSLSEPLHVICSAENGIASQEKVCEKMVSLKHLRPPQPQQCDLAFEYEEFQMRCIPVENATHYEVSVWRMSSSNTSLILDRRALYPGVGVAGGQVSARGGAAASWLVRGALGQLRAGDEAGAAACNRYGCSRDMLLRPSDGLLYAAAPPWWSFILDKEVGISLGAVVLVAVFLISSYLAIQAARRPAPRLQVLQLDHVARDYLHALEHKRNVGVACSIRSCSSGYSGGSRDLELDAPAVDRHSKPFYYWEGPPPDVTLTLARESAV